MLYLMCDAVGELCLWLPCHRTVFSSGYIIPGLQSFFLGVDNLLGLFAVARGDYKCIDYCICSVFL